MAENKIPDKLTFKRKEVMQMTKLDGRVLDYWEKEFCAFIPVVNQSGEKFYSRRDVEVILSVKQWLVQEKRDKGQIQRAAAAAFRRPGRRPGAAPAPTAVNPEKLRKIRRGLKEILTLLAKDDKS